MPDPALVASIETALAGRGARRCGSEIRFRCVVVGHEDRRPSARWHPERHVWRCDVCGVGGGAVDLARRLGIVVGRRTWTSAERRVIARLEAKRCEREAHARALRMAWLDALAELREAQAEVALLRALVRDDMDERAPRTTALLDEIGDAYLRELLAEQRLDEIEAEEREAREGVRRAAA